MSLKNMYSNSLAIAVLAVLLLGSCQSGNKSASSESAADTLNKDTIAQVVKEVVYPLPTPFEMTQMLENIGAKYIATSLNPVDKADKYFTEKDKAVNLGVYGADLAYAATYNQKQQTELDLKAIKTLVDQLGITVDYSSLLSDQFKDKMNNKDSLIKVVTDTFYSTYQYLNEKSNPDLAVMMVSGMWVELMYLASHISKDTYSNTDIVKIIFEQKESLTKLTDLLGTRNSNSDIKDLQNKLLVLKGVYDNVQTSLTKAELNTIITTIETVRASFVK